jgi:hypothetical protein
MLNKDYEGRWMRKVIATKRNAMGIRKVGYNNRWPPTIALVVPRRHGHQCARAAEDVDRARPTTAKSLANVWKSFLRLPGIARRRTKGAAELRADLTTWASGFHSLAEAFKMVEPRGVEPLLAKP